MTATPTTASHVSGPLLNATQLGAFLAELTRSTRDTVHDHARREIAACVDILTMDSLKKKSLASTCAVLKMNPWAPLLEQARATMSGRLDATPIATLTPVTADEALGWVLTDGIPTAKEHCAQLPQAEYLPVAGPEMVITANTGFPTWLDDATVAEISGYDLDFLRQTPAQVRAAAGLPHVAVVPRMITGLLEEPVIHEKELHTRMAAARAHSLLRQVVTNTAAEAGRELDPRVKAQLDDTDALEKALVRFRAAAPDPADTAAAVAVAEQILLDLDEERHQRELEFRSRQAHLAGRHPSR